MSAMRTPRSGSGTEGFHCVRSKHCRFGFVEDRGMNLLVSFAGVTALLGSALVGFALLSRNQPSTLFFIGGAICYVGGTFLVTMLGNVPLNDQLAAVPATDPDAAKLWGHYLDRWTMWNHVRTLAAFVAALLYAAGLVSNGVS